MGHLCHGSPVAVQTPTPIRLASAARRIDSSAIRDLLRVIERPDVISLDIHQLSIHGPLFDMPTCLSKFLALGMAFPDLIRAATARPAEVLGLQHELGTLKVGALADVALFTIQPGHFPFYDVFMNMREGTQLIRNTLTIANGRPLPRTPDAAPAPWIELSEGQRALIERGHTPDGFSK